MLTFINFAIIISGMINLNHSSLKGDGIVNGHLKKNSTLKFATYSTYLNGIDGFSIEVKTIYLDDREALDYQLLGNPNQVVTKQTLIFRNKDNIILETNFHVKKKSIKIKGKNLIVLDNVIVQIGIIKGKDKGFYKIDGYGGCNGCSEYWGAYSMHGKLLNESYSLRGSFDYEFGNFNGIVKKYNLDSAFLKANELEVIWVFPPKYSGKKSKSLIR